MQKKYHKGNGNPLFFNNIKRALGVTLPFLSYGGSSLLVSMASIGIVLNISKKTN